MLFHGTCLISDSAFGHLIFTNGSDESGEVSLMNVVKGVTMLPYPV